MGKTRGHGSRRGAYRGARNASKGRGGGEEEDSSEEEEYEQPRGLGAQRSNVGMLPPSDSDEDEGEEGGEKPAKDSSKPAGSSAKGGQSKNAGKLPPSGSEDEEDDDSEEESSEEPLNEYLSSSAPRKKKEVEEEPDPAQIAKDMERLALIKRKREEDRLKRIADEGWDRFAPVSETNKPPGHVPSDHPSHKE